MIRRKMGFGVSLNGRRVSWGEGKRTFLRGSQRCPVGGIPAPGTCPPFGVLGFSSQAAPRPTGRTDTESPPPGPACSPRYAGRKCEAARRSPHASSRPREASGRPLPLGPRCASGRSCPHLTRGPRVGKASRANGLYPTKQRTGALVVGLRLEGPR